MVDQELKTLLLGALLHDIGKFRMRAVGPIPGKDHSQIGEEWLHDYQDRGLLPSGVAALADWHHNTHLDESRKSNAALIVSEADNLAAQSEAEAKEDLNLAPECIPLTAILSTIEGQAGVTPSRRYFPVQQMTGRLTFPQELADAAADQEQYQILWSQFETEFARWCSSGCHINGLLGLLERFCSYIPSETLWNEAQPATHPDISLFDHMKTTAAVANCLFNRLKEDCERPLSEMPFVESISDRNAQNYLLVGGDLSGVQDFIYTISSRGALKTLRARSFFLEIFCEHLVTQIIGLAGLTRASVIYCGGGRFNLIAANTGHTLEVLATVEKKCNHWLLDQFNGRLALMLASAPFNGSEFSTSNISNVWAELGEELAEKKQRKFSAFIDRLLTPQEPKLPDSNCQICHRDDIASVTGHGIKGLEYVCPFCAQLYRFGERLPKIKAFSYQPLASIDGDCIEMFDCGNGEPMGLAFYEEIPEQTTGLIYAMNYLDGHALQNPDLVQILVSRYARRNRDLAVKPLDDEAFGNALASFEDLARQARGVSRIGVLRMDVDHLGWIFKAGLPEGKRTFTRLAAVSRQLSLFFKLYLDQVLAGNAPEEMILEDLSEKQPRRNGRNVTVVYSGGDDIFIVGAWDEIAEVSMDIHNAFQGFVGGNPNVTISGGFVIQRHDFPLYRLAKLAEEAEKAGKENGRDSMSFFFDPQYANVRHKMQNQIPMTFKWNDVPEKILAPLRELKTFGKITNNSFQSGTLSKSDIGRFYLVLEKWEAEGILYLPQLAYIIGRMNKDFRKTTFGQRLMHPYFIKDLRSALLWIILMAQKKG